MNLNSAIRAINSKLSALQVEKQRLEDAIRVLSKITEPEAKPEAKPSAKKRRRAFLCTVTCKRCGNHFKAKRHPGNGTAPQSKVLFCHKPCCSSMYNREQRQNARAKEQTFKSTILPGDPLRAAH